MTHYILLAYIFFHWYRGSQSAAVVATSSIRAKTLCRAINVLEAESFHKLIFNCHIQVERKAFPHHHLLYWAQLQGILPCCSIFSPFPWKEKGREKNKKKTGRKERKLAYVSFTIAEVSCTVECWPTIRAWQMGTERVLWEYWHLFRPSEWRESEVCAWLAARRWSFSGRPRNNTRTPRKKKEPARELSGQSGKWVDKSKRLWELIYTAWWFHDMHVQRSTFSRTRTPTLTACKQLGLVFDHTLGMVGRFWGARHAWSRCFLRHSDTTLCWKVHKHRVEEKNANRFIFVGSKFEQNPL